MHVLLAGDLNAKLGDAPDSIESTQHLQLHGSKLQACLSIRVHKPHLHGRLLLNLCMYSGLILKHWTLGW